MEPTEIRVLVSLLRKLGLSGDEAASLLRLYGITEQQLIEADLQTVN